MSRKQDARAFPDLRRANVLFVGGIPRSGTTLMRVLLDTHPDIRCGEETHILPTLLDFVDHFRKQKRMKLAGVTPEIFDMATAAFISTVMQLHGPPAEIICNKDPFMLKHTRKLAQMFPEAKFILMLRDGRAAVHSMIVRKVAVANYDRRNPWQMLQMWNENLKSMFSQCVILGPNRCLPVYYEKLVLSTEQQMRRITNFLGIEWTGNFLEHEKHVGSDVKLSPAEYSTNQVKQKVSEAALDAWVGFFDDHINTNIDKIAPLLSELHYDTKSAHPKYDHLPILWKGSNFTLK
uniref:Protein-tyrosine sulfotransferase n=1 Tax=Panagrellus redivivus TaxID=6233 RepID=A0A7E4UU72_PANRE